MNIGNQILNIRKDNQLTQEEFGKLFHVTRQTVSNWENGKSYPDLQILVSMSDQFDISPDSLIRTTVIIVGIIMIGIGWYKKSKNDKKVFQYIKEHD